MEVTYYYCRCDNCWGIEGVKAEKDTCPNCCLLGKRITHSQFVDWQITKGHVTMEGLEEKAEVRRKKRKYKYVDKV